VTEVARTGGRPLGLAFDRDGNLVICDIGVERVLVLRPDGTLSTLAEEAGGLRLGFPNGAVFDAEGSLYISNSFDTSLSALAAAAGSTPLTDHDRLVRLPNERMAAEVRDRAPSGSLCRIGPGGGSEVLARGLYCPNGIAIDPGETAVYVLQSTLNNCVRVPLAGGDPEVFAEFPSPPDGIAFDCDGNAIVTLPLVNRIVVVDPRGAQETLVDDPDATVLDLPTNCAFGGEDFDELYVGHVIADHVARVPYPRPGHRLYHLR
jgi:sugar lactone lactonase YvrE